MRGHVTISVLVHGLSIVGKNSGIEFFNFAKNLGIRHGAPFNNSGKK